MVTSERFERPTYCLEGSCSIQLSYEATAILYAILISWSSVYSDKVSISMRFLWT